MGERTLGRRIMVIGGCGAGKTTFSNKLADLTGLPLSHLDRLGWRGSWEKVPQEEFDELLGKVIERDAWIVDGNYNRTIPMRLKRADTVIWFDFSGIRCLAGVVGRFFRNRGKSRDDIGGNCTEKLNLEKLRFFHATLWGAGKMHRRIADCLKDAPDKIVVVFKTRKQADRFLEELAVSANQQD